jgi:hypothetical protein
MSHDTSNEDIEKETLKWVDIKERGDEYTDIKVYQPKFHDRVRVRVLFTLIAIFCIFLSIHYILFAVFSFKLPPESCSDSIGKLGSIFDKWFPVIISIVSSGIAFYFGSNRSKEEC